jgi:hypothetical protein
MLHHPVGGCCTAFATAVTRSNTCAERLFDNFAQFDCTARSTLCCIEALHTTAATISDGNVKSRVLVRICSSCLFLSSFEVLTFVLQKGGSAVAAALSAPVTGSTSSAALICTL